VLAEGWKWVEVAVEFDHERVSDVRRLRPKPVRLSDEQQATLDALEAEYTELAEGGDEDSDSEALQSIEEQIEAIAGRAQYRPKDVAIAGAFVTLGRNGEPQIERGFVRRDDEKSPAEGEGDVCAQSEADEIKPLSAALVAELTATRTLFLREALSQKPDVALIAVTHALAASIFFPHTERVSCLEIDLRSASLTTHAPSIGDMPAAKTLAAQHEKWSRRLPEEPAKLWDYLRKLAAPARLELLAHCVAMSANALQLPHARENAAWAHADELASAVKFDFAKHWQPTVANYLGRVSKERVIEAVREGASEQEAIHLGGMKKQDMATAAERLLAGKGWMPSLLRQ